MTLRISYQLSEAIRYRRKNRIFGDIDNNIRELSATEIFSHELDLAIPKFQALFDRDNTFYRMFNDER